MYGYFVQHITSSSTIDLFFVGNSLNRQEKQVILVIPPKRGKEELFSSKHFEALYDYVTAFSLMTYDFSNSHRPGKEKSPDTENSENKHNFKHISV